LIPLLTHLSFRRTIPLKRRKIRLKARHYQRNESKDQDIKYLRLTVMVADYIGLPQSANLIISAHGTLIRPEAVFAFACAD
jgi:hypothetical protein